MAIWQSSTTPCPSHKNPGKITECPKVVIGHSDKAGLTIAMGQWHFGVVVAVGCWLGALPGAAVVILDSTWAEEGGTADNPTAGFGAHIELANQPQFAATIAMSGDGKTVGECAGVWLGNDRRRGYVLTAAHCFDDGYGSSSYFYHTSTGAVMTGYDLAIHPRYIDVGETPGYDLAIVTLNQPVRGLAAAVLYAGADEYEQVVTFVGYGIRGIASVGEDINYHDGLPTKAAAQGFIDQLVESREEGDYFGIFLPRENGSLRNPNGGPRRPITRFAGLLGVGDSGGPAFIETTAGWVVAGINSSGSGVAQYGDMSWFVRVAAAQSWIELVFAGAQFWPSAPAVKSIQSGG